MWGWIYSENIKLDMNKILFQPFWSASLNNNNNKKDHPQIAIQWGGKNGTSGGMQWTGENISRAISSLLGRSVCGEENTSGGTWRGEASLSTLVLPEQPHWASRTQTGGRGITARVGSQTARWKQNIPVFSKWNRKTNTSGYALINLTW